jgi:hypothetical protein
MASLAAAMAKKALTNPAFQRAAFNTARSAASSITPNQARAIANRYAPSLSRYTNLAGRFPSPPQTSPRRNNQRRPINRGGVFQVGPRNNRSLPSNYGSVSLMQGMNRFLTGPALPVTRSVRNFTNLRIQRAKQQKIQRLQAKSNLINRKIAQLQSLQNRIRRVINEP